MVGTTDIPDWCYVETYGTKGKDKFTEAPSAEDLTLFYSKSPISHLSKVCTPTYGFEILNCCYIITQYFKHASNKGLENNNCMSICINNKPAVLGSRNS